MSNPAYTPEMTLSELRHHRDAGFGGAELAAIMRRAADAAATANWPDPYQREQAGLGCVVAAATLTEYADEGRAGALVTAIGLFGLALVESGRRDQGRSVTRA